MPSIVLPTDTRATLWATPNGNHSFHPYGSKRWSSGYRPNRTSWESADTYSARLFVGFNIGTDTVFEMKDLVALVREVREAQVDDPSSSFVYQHGIYKHHSGEVVEEPGAQVIIINMGASPKVFARQMVELAERICDEMSQEEVVVEIQHNGLVDRVLGVSADE
jgi:hypothetical protein